MTYRITTIADLFAAVCDLRPDAGAAGVDVTEADVRCALAQCGNAPYAEIDADMLGEIADRAVDIAEDAA